MLIHAKKTRLGSLESGELFSTHHLLLRLLDDRVDHLRDESLFRLGQLGKLIELLL